MQDHSYSNAVPARGCAVSMNWYTVFMEAKRGPSAGEKAGNADVAPVISSTESSSSTKKNVASRPTPSESAADVASESKSSLFFERPDDPKNNGDKIDRPSLFADEKNSVHEDSEKSAVSAEHDEKAVDHETAEHTPLTNEQELQVVEEYTRDRLEIVDTELAAAQKNSADAFIARADKVLLEHIAQAVHERANSHASSDEILDSASVKAEEALHMTHDVEHNDASHEMSEAERDSLIDSILHGTDDSESPAETYALNETSSEADAYEDDPPVAMSFGSGGPSGPTPPEYDLSTGDDDPNPDHSAYNHAVGDGSGATGGVAAASSGGTVRAQSESPPPAQNESQRRHDFNNGLLIGGVLGYVVGRHHGRKKAERAVKPELARHKKEVDALQQKIIAREQHIRSLAANKVIAQQVETHALLDSHKEAFGKATLSSTETPVTPNPKLSAELVGAAAVAIGRPTTAEAAKPEAVMAAARARSLAVEQPRAEQPVVAETPGAQTSPIQNRIEPRPKLRSKDVAQLPQRELENVAQTIPVRGQTLRKIYESGQVDKEGLRRIVTEYVRTGNVGRLIDAEVAAAKFRKRSPELAHGSTGVAAVALAEAATTQTQTSGHTHTQVTNTGLKPDSLAKHSVGAEGAAGHVRQEKTLNGKVVIVAAVILAVAIILLVSRH